jgi:hypothetical protein
MKDVAMCFANVSEEHTASIFSIEELAADLNA